MAANERYIFFRTVPVGPVGSAGVPLTAGRSLAADASVYPRAASRSSASRDARTRQPPGGTPKASHAADPVAIGARYSRCGKR
jgi:hypothetical protein